MKYLIDVPPPTISGSTGLHIGHIFSYTQGDIIARYQKYCSNDVLYPFCFDCNGLPTQKAAGAKKIKTQSEIIEFAVEKSVIYHDTFREAGIVFSENTYHTFEEQTIKVVYEAFNYLKDRGIAYKKETEFLYSEKMKCSVSQSELDDNGIIEKTGEIPMVKTGIGWFIDIKNHLPQIQAMIDKIEWHPLKYKKRADDWLSQIEWDWSISRERHFGIPIPGEDNMTFDTWFVSSLTPQLAWASETGTNSIKSPVFDVRFQAHDIIRSWAFYTICMSYLLNNDIPWRNIVITGHVLDGEGNKESKSSGNSTPPKQLISKHGPYGIRHWATSNTLGLDTKIDEDKMKMGWRIKNKFDNARKFINMQIANSWIGEDESLYEAYLNFKAKILISFDNFEFDKANFHIYDFLWNNMCDIWIENSKKKPTSITLEKILTDFEPLFKIIYC